MIATFGYQFPAIRGVQAGREYYVSMCPLRLIPKIFLFDEEELVPELRAQRSLNKSRVPEMAQYIVQNKNDYVFSAITASIDADVEFQSISEDGDEARQVGVLSVPMDARFIINDGQHRRAAIEAALRDEPAIGNETIAVVFFLDVGLQRCQQMFADLNRHAIRPSKSIGVLYDSRDAMARLAKNMVVRSPFFRDIVEMERSTLSLRSRKLFTLSSIYAATCVLLNDIEFSSIEDGIEIAGQYWHEVARNIVEWERVRDHKLTSGEVRQQFVHSHGVVLQALGVVGNALLLSNRPWKTKLKTLRKIDWRRSNTKLWEGRAMVGGRVSKSSHNVTLTANAIKQSLGLELGPEEQRVEDSKEGNLVHGK